MKIPNLITKVHCLVAKKSPLLILYVLKLERLTSMKKEKLKSYFSKRKYYSYILFYFESTIIYFYKILHISLMFQEIKIKILIFSINMRSNNKLYIIILGLANILTPQNQYNKFQKTTLFDIDNGVRGCPSDCC